MGINRKNPMKLIDFWNFMREPRVRKVIRNHQLRIKGDDCEIWIEPAETGKSDFSIVCKTNEAIQKIEELIKDVNKA